MQFFTILSNNEPAACCWNCCAESIREVTIAFILGLVECFLNGGSFWV